MLSHIFLTFNIKFPDSIMQSKFMRKFYSKQRILLIRLKSRMKKLYNVTILYCKRSPFDIRMRLCQRYASVYRLRTNKGMCLCKEMFEQKKNKVLKGLCMGNEMSYQKNHCCYRATLLLTTLSQYNRNFTNKSLKNRRLKGYGN